MGDQETGSERMRAALLVASGDASSAARALQRVVMVQAPTGAAAEQYRLLAIRLEELAQRGIRRVAITSASRGEGRTTTAVNAALALARRHRVLLVDGDFRRPGVHRALGIAPVAGLADVLCGRANLDSTLLRFGPEPLYVLPAGVTLAPHLSVAEPELARLLANFGEHFDHVIVDTPAILPVADVATLARSVDGLAIVVRTGRTRRDLLELALSALPRDRVIGFVLHAARREAGLSWQQCEEHDRATAPSHALTTIHH